MTLPSYDASSAVEGNTPGNGSTFVITRPAAWTNGDTAYAGLYKESSAAVTPPSGWTELSGSPFAQGTSFWLHVFRKVLGGSEPASYTWSWTGSTWREGGGLALLDTDQTTPENQGPTGQTNASSATLTCPAVTPSVANTLLLTFAALFNDVTWTSANSGQTMRLPINAGRAFGAATKTGPASGVSSGTLTYTVNTAAINLGVTIAVQEVQGGGAESHSGAAASRAGADAQDIGSKAALSGPTGRAGARAQLVGVPANSSAPVARAGARAQTVGSQPGVKSAVSQAGARAQCAGVKGGGGAALGRAGSRASVAGRMVASATAISRLGGRGSVAGTTARASATASRAGARAQAAGGELAAVPTIVPPIGAVSNTGRHAGVLVTSGRVSALVTTSGRSSGEVP